MPLLAHADFSLEAKGNTEILVQNYLQDVEETLPSLMKSGINKKIFIEFKTMPETKNLVLGQVVQLPIFKEKANTVVLNERLLTNIRDNKDYQVAKATLLHEISHIFDFQNKQLAFEKELNITNKNYSISDSPVFLNLTGWKKKKQKNQKHTRRVDVYEDRSPQETFAVNFEWFVTDPEYKCRKPGLYHYLSKSLETIPFEDTICETEYALAPTVDAQGKLENTKVIDPKRLYQVHYLFAGKGREMMSRWGHAMVRLVMCSPQRKAVDEKCLQDRAHHLVLSFRANITNFKVDSIKGLTGKYPSRMFVLSMGDVINEYTVGEMRDLFSIPLKMDEEQKKNFVELVLERYWGYQGKYYFITNNCAHETLSLLKPVFPHDVNLVNLKVSTPLGIKDELEKEGIADMSVFDNLDDAKKKGYFFESLDPKLKKIFSELKAAGVITSDQESFLNKTTTDERRIIIDNTSNNLVLGKLLLIERTIIARKSIEIQKNIAKKLDEAERSGEKDELLNLYRYLETTYKNLAGLDLSHGYGIPQKKDKIFLLNELSEEDQKRLEQGQKIYVELLQAMFKKDYSQLKDSASIQQTLLNKISKGLK
jgi:hypothetical protein